DPRLMNRATPYPCIGPHDNARSTSTSSVPCSKSSEVAVMPGLYHQHLRESSERSQVPGLRSQETATPFPPETGDLRPETCEPRSCQLIAISPHEALRLRS